MQLHFGGESLFLLCGELICPSVQVESPFLCRLLNTIDSNGLIEGRGVGDSQKEVPAKEEL